jgi:hypothetical protein
LRAGEAVARIKRKAEKLGADAICEFKSELEGFSIGKGGRSVASGIAIKFANEEAKREFIARVAIPRVYGHLRWHGLALIVWWMIIVSLWTPPRFLAIAMLVMLLEGILCLVIKHRVLFLLNAVPLLALALCFWLGFVRRYEPSTGISYHNMANSVLAMAQLGWSVLNIGDYFSIGRLKRRVATA